MRYGGRTDVRTHNKIVPPYTLVWGSLRLAPMKIWRAESGTRLASFPGPPFYSVVHFTFVQPNKAGGLGTWLGRDVLVHVVRQWFTPPAHPDIRGQFQSGSRWDPREG